MALGSSLRRHETAAAERLLYRLISSYGQLQSSGSGPRKSAFLKRDVERAESSPNTPHAAHQLLPDINLHYPVPAGAGAGAPLAQKSL